MDPQSLMWSGSNFQAMEIDERSNLSQEHSTNAMVLNKIWPHYNA